ncbi:MAG: hypothetical protein QUV05_00970 [Phycisphaerae bacterium]|nr:hypothetical protein [Phycisphaerae bacterium]
MTKHLWRMSVPVVMVCSGVSFAVIFFEDRGAWSSDWSKELEPCRARASTISEQPIGGGEVYTIPFADRGDFEKIWPVLVTLKSKGAPLILRSGGVEVRRRCPVFSDVSLDLSGVKKDDSAEPDDWISAVRLRTVAKESKEYCAGWPVGTYPGVKIYAPSTSCYAKGSSAYAGAEAQDHSTMGRSTTVIELFVGDGKVIDLNRIRLPAETPIVDNRVFESEQKQPTTKPANP